jgi:glycosyltransferase involved in cell wall biosynthesis
MKLNVTILQGQIPAYRVPFYNALSHRFSVTVIHGGKRVAGEGDAFKEIVLPVRQVGPFSFLEGLGRHLANNPEAIVSMFDLRWPQFIARPAKSSRSRFLLWGHRYSRREPVNLLRDILLKRSDGAILYGEEEFQRMLNRGLRSDKIFVAPNTIAIPNHEDTSIKPKSSLLYLGRLQERKRLDVILRAFAATYKELPGHVTFEIVGDGEERKPLEQLARTLLPAGKVVFHGTQTDHALLKAHFSKAAAYVSDNVGLGLLHSFSYGVPVVTFHHATQIRTDFRHGPEMHDFKDGVNGVLCNSEGDLRDVIIRLFSQPSWASSLGRHAYTLYKNSRTMEHMVEGFASAIFGTSEKVSGSVAGEMKHR